MIERPVAPTKKNGQAESGIVADQEIGGAVVVPVDGFDVIR